MTNKLTNWNKPQKGIARSFAVKNEGIIADVYFGMPSHSCFDLKEGLRNGTLTRKTQVVVVDNKPKNWEKIRRFLVKNFDEFIFYKGDVEDFPMAQMMESRGFGKINFAFFDLCGHFNDKVTKWAYDNREAFTSDCRYGLTVTAPTRIKNWEKLVHKTAMSMDYHHELENLIVESKNNLAKDIVGLPIDVKKHRQAIKKKRASELTNVIKSIKSACYSFMMAYNNFNMSVNRIFRYKESNGDGKHHIEMVFIDFRFCGDYEGDDICIDIVNSKPPKKVSYIKTGKKPGRPAYIDHFNITCFADLNKAGIKAAITRMAKKEAIEMGKTVEERRLRIISGIKAGLTKRLKAAA